MRGIDLRDLDYRNYTGDKLDKLFYSPLTAHKRNLYEYLPNAQSTDIDVMFLSPHLRREAIRYKAVLENAMRIGKWCAAEAGLDPSAYADMDAVAASA